jgi:hypothetical protein
MNPHDVSEVLLSDKKFKELYEAIQECYQAINECWDKIRCVDTILGTAIKDSVKMKQLQNDAIESFERGFNDKSK